jgi:hypothetical protein
MNTHQFVLPTTTITLPNVSVLRTQAMNPGIGHLIIPINYQTTWSQHVTPIDRVKPICYLLQHTQCGIMSYPLFVPLDLNLYPRYPTRIKGLDFSIFRNYIGYVLGNVYPILEQLIVPPTYILYFIGNQFPIMVQLVTSKDKQHVIALMPTIVSNY